jgi:hypothetical protein
MKGEVNSPRFSGSGVGRWVVVGGSGVRRWVVGG